MSIILTHYANYGAKINILNDVYHQYWRQREAEWLYEQQCIFEGLCNHLDF